MVRDEPNSRLPSDTGPRRVLVVASGGGHWVQLSRTFAALAGHDVACVSTIDGYRYSIAAAHPTWRYYQVRDANAREKWALLKMAGQIARILWKERPHVVISTGAAPGYTAVRMGKWLGAQTIWLDSAANFEKLSLSGQHIGADADLWLTQWERLARPGGPSFAGRVFNVSMND